MANNRSNSVSVAGVAAQVVTLPGRFRGAGNVSMKDLLEATRYHEISEHVSEAAIRAALGKCSECAQDWIEYSEDKRTGGWYVTENDGRYQVGYVAENGDLRNQINHDNVLDAVASFIKHEIEDIQHL